MLLGMTYTVSQHVAPHAACCRSGRSCTCVMAMRAFVRTLHNILLFIKMEGSTTGVTLQEHSSKVVNTLQQHGHRSKDDAS